MMNNLDTGRIGAALRFLSIENKLSQTKLAEKAGMSQSALNRRFSGETSLTLEDVNHLAEVLGYTVTVSFEKAA